MINDADAFLQRSKWCSCRPSCCDYDLVGSFDDEVKVVMVLYSTAQWWDMPMMITFTLNFCVSVSSICIGVHASCHLIQWKSLIPHLLVAMSAVLALDLRVPFESWCDKYWMLRVNTLHATCLLDYIDGGYSLTQLTSDSTTLSCDSQSLQISVYHSFTRLRGLCQALVVT